MSGSISINAALRELVDRLRAEDEWERADVLTQLAGAWDLADKNPRRDAWQTDVDRVNDGTDPETAEAFDRLTSHWTPGQPKEIRPGFIADLTLMISEGRRPSREELVAVAVMFADVLGYGDEEIIAGIRLAVERSKVTS